MTPFYPIIRTLSFLCLVFISFPVFAQDTQERYQGFEGSINDNWNYTVAPPRYVADEGDDVWADTTATGAIQPATDQKFWFMRDLENENGGIPGFHTMDFEAVDVSAYAFNTITFRYYSHEYEDSDSIGYILDLGGGGSFDMAGYVDLNRNTGAWETVYINVPSGAAAVSLRLMAKQNGTNDYAGFDDVSIFSSTEDVIAPLVTAAEVTGASSVRITYSETMDQAGVEDPANYTADAAISSITYAEPGDGSSFVDITFTEDFVAGQAYSLTVGPVTDASGNFLLIPFTFDYIYNNTTPLLVITEIFYHPPSDEGQEFIEIYNAGSQAALGGLKVSGEFSFTFPAGLSLPAGEILLLAYDEAVAEAFFGEDFIGWGATEGLGNGGGDIIITNFSGVVIDEVSYDDNDPWPVAADGDGPSLELAAIHLDNNAGSNWLATTRQFGDTDVFATPGAIADVLTPAISFMDAAVALEEGSGMQALGLIINNPGPASSRAVLFVAGASTAVEGVDYTLGSTTIDFPAESSEPQFLNIDILDNNSLGGRYLILGIGQLINGELGATGQLFVLIKDNDIAPPAPPVSPGAGLVHLGSYESGASAEIVAHDPGSQRLFIANARDNRLDIVNFSDPSSLGPVNSISLSALYDGSASSVAVHDGVVAVAMAARRSWMNGSILFFETNGFLQNTIEVGPLPDMLAFTPDGSKLLVANEGEPREDYLVDPEGSVSIIDMTVGMGNLLDVDVTTVSFAGFNADSAGLVAQGVRLFGPGATVAQDLEPEYIAISDDGTTAYVACQENNALVIVDIETATATGILPLGYKDWSAEGILFDASDRAPDIFFANWPVRGMYQPDAVDYFAVGGQGYLITANEGNARDYGAFSEEFRVGDDEIVLDPSAFPNAAYLKEDALLGRLHITAATGDTDGDGDYDELYAFGGRSFSIWNAETGELVYDSGSDLEVIIANDPVFGVLFNADEDGNEPKGRSDDKGPEPEAVTVGVADGVPYAFVGMERIGGVMVFELSDPSAPRYIQYINTRNLNFPGGDLSPEDLIFISPENSPNAKALLVASHEVSGTVAVFEVGTGATVSFAESSTIVPEGAGQLQLEVVVEAGGALAGEARVNVVSASTAVEGEDYTLASTSLTFPENSSASQLITLDILDNNAPGGRYLILELERPDGSLLRLGGETRHILLIQDDDDTAPAAQADPYLQMNYLGSYSPGLNSTMKAVDFDGESRRLFAANPEAAAVEILDYSDPSNVTRISSFSVTPYGGGVNSVAVRNGVVAVAVRGNDTADNGKVVFFDTDGNFLNEATVGNLPEMLLFSPDGTKVLTANEGEPSSGYAVDLEGSVSIVDISGGVANATVVTLGFEAFNGQQAALEAQGVRIFGPNATVAQDLEPEYIAISDDGSTAYITCQENNALAVADLIGETITAILPLGNKDWAQPGLTFDASDRSGDIFFANWPVKGLCHPDAIDYFTVGGAGYLITANEGEARDYDTYSEEFRIGDDEIVLDPDAFPDAEYLKEEVLLGRLRITGAGGDTDGDGDYDELFAYGARSFTIWNAETGEVVFDSGNDLEQITAAGPAFGDLFNSDNVENGFKGRSDDKGPEPEAVLVAEIDGRQFAFIGLERIGGIMAYEVTDPAAPEFIQYINTRTVGGLGGDLGPEGLAFIPASASPSGRPMLSVAYEISGTLALFELRLNCPITSLPGEELYLCEGETAVLEVSGNYDEIGWSTGEAGASIVVEQAGAYTVLATTAGGCVAMDTVEVIVTPRPAVSLGPDITACSGQAIALNAGPGFATYAWSNGSANSFISLDEGGEYSVTATNGFGCEASDTVTVVIHPSPVPNFPQDTVICAQDITIFDPGPGNFYIIDGVPLEDFVIAGFAPYTYSVEALLSNGFDCEVPIVLNFTVDVCVGTEDIALAESIELFPNPASGRAAVRLCNLRGADYGLEVFNAAGQLIWQSRIMPLQGAYQAEIGLEGMSPGIYLVRLVSADGLLVKRLAVE